jgi:DNA-binding MarR family transcriptional regulator
MKRNKERKTPSMIAERFYIFTLLIDGIHKCIHRIKFDFAPHFGVKSVHMFWIYELRNHPNGLTAAELAECSRISRSLVSREIERLRENGYVEIRETARGKRKNYSSPICLTEKGRELADSICAEAMKIQERAGEGISEEELIVFYSTLSKFYNNLCGVIRESDGDKKPSEDDDLPQGLPDLMQALTGKIKKD